MDIFSHGLWAAAGAKGVNGSSRLGSSNKQFNPYWAFFWGMFPDLFAFTIPFILLFWSMLAGETALRDWPRPERGEPPASNHWAGVQIASTLYPYSHSLVIFTIVVLIVWGIAHWRKRRMPLEMFGWLLHILIDIPTHTYRFFPTPAFWPISQWKFDGFSWANPVFMVVNYGLLVILFLWLRRKKRIISWRSGKTVSGTLSKSS